VSVTAAEFREAMGCLAGGVTVVTTRDEHGAPRGFTATAVCSVSLEPPLVLMCVGHEGQTLEAIRASGTWALNFLRNDGAEASGHFAGTIERKFEGVAWTPAPAGSPLLAGAVAWVECSAQREVEAGDHTIFIGRVTDARVEEPGEMPLVHFGGRYHTLVPLDS
jgi:flavin reductase (DIM6/NTAB) family NADH-FMN oxidoreductase RutF